MPDVNTPGSKVTEINPSVVSRVVQAVRYAISGVAPETWFGPLQPLQPMAPADVKGRQFDYQTGVNLNYTPRSTEPLGFIELRALAECCDIMRTVIETRKDQIEAFDWSIRVKNATRSNKIAEVTKDQKKRIDDITAFFVIPDKEHNFAQWLRMIMEDMFVIDAVAIYKRRDRGGKLFALELIAGDTIKPLLADDGRRPFAPDPAYQQVLKGIPAADFSSEELAYVVRNPRTNRIYGYSHVEQIIITINTLVRRALFQLDYYLEGSQPDAFMGLPKEWNPDQIISFAKRFQDEMSGNLALRRRLKFVPADFKYQETKQKPLGDEYDEWLARIVCFCFSISPQPFVKTMNRATAATAHDQSREEGLAPLQRYIKNILNPIIAQEFDSADLEFSFDDDIEQDAKQASDIRVAEVKSGIISLDEAREQKGMQPLGGAYAIPMLATATGFVAPGEEEDDEDDMDANGNPKPKLDATGKPLPDAPVVPPKQKAKDNAARDKKRAEVVEDDEPTAKAASAELRKAGGRKPLPFQHKSYAQSYSSSEKKRVIYSRFNGQGCHETTEDASTED